MWHMECNISKCFALFCQFIEKIKGCFYFTHMLRYLLFYKSGMYSGSESVTQFWKSSICPQQQKSFVINNKHFIYFYDQSPLRFHPCCPGQHTVKSGWVAWLLWTMTLAMCVVVYLSPLLLPFTQAKHFLVETQAIQINLCPLPKANSVAGF